SPNLLFLSVPLLVFRVLVVLLTLLLLREVTSLAHSLEVILARPRALPEAFRLVGADVEGAGYMVMSQVLLGPAPDAEDGNHHPFVLHGILVVRLAARVDLRRTQLLDDLLRQLLGDDPRHGSAAPPDEFAEDSDLLCRPRPKLLGRKGVQVI